MIGTLAYSITVAAEASIKAAEAAVEDRKKELAEREKILKTLSKKERLKQKTAWELIDAVRYSGRSCYRSYNYYRSNGGIW